MTSTRRVRRVASSTARSSSHREAATLASSSTSATRATECERVTGSVSTSPPARFRATSSTRALPRTRGRRRGRVPPGSACAPAHRHRCFASRFDDGARRLHLGAPVVAQPASTTTWLTRLALLAILAVAALLVGWNIGREGISNDYYAAAVRSMLDDPVAFLFAGFDGGRYITIDKPPLGYQLQAVSAAILGFGGSADPAAAARGIRRVGLARVPPCSPGVGIGRRPRGGARARADAGLRRRGTEHDGRCHPRDCPPARRALPSSAACAPGVSAGSPSPSRWLASGSS